jgi:hypothetical protein
VERFRPRDPSGFGQPPGRRWPRRPAACYWSGGRADPAFWPSVSRGRRGSMETRASSTQLPLGLLRLLLRQAATERQDGASSPIRRRIGPPQNDARSDAASQNRRIAWRRVIGRRLTDQRVRHDCGHHRSCTCHPHVHNDSADSGRTRITRLMRPIHTITSNGRRISRSCQPVEDGGAPKRAPDARWPSPSRRPAPLSPALDARGSRLDRAGPSGAIDDPVILYSAAASTRAGRCDSS